MLRFDAFGKQVGIANSIAGIWSHR